MTVRVLVPIVMALIAGCGSVTGEGPGGSITLCLPADERLIPLEAELAVTPSARQKGLSGRKALSRRAGMLFVYPRQQGPDNSFWMHRTRIPLTILFLDGQGVVRSVQDMAPCLEASGSGCPSYPAGVDHWMALEVNQGLPAALGISEGDSIRLSRAGGTATCDNAGKLTPASLPEAH
ncbi:MULTISPECIES: DUF192 domain-containing protein [Halomonadaceae]|uniref:DUF192 domain-containing protein n=1 Tax=Vreelandella halophila TaxID=86177 RepID=A0A9X4Y9D8_9GAMM|nr:MULTISPECIES: DUF192 domain-containing protein [Halomonas]MYL25762.1 DUF192 domain-containing protein [Halomonas utahensis]MYL75708.1 DUF192 domain-containing protein [Halomonas sp. 22501_18_FS]